MTKRNPLVVVALTFFTFTLYAYYWLYKTTAELKEETDRDDLNPLADLLLAVVTFGLWGVWAAIRNARVVHQEMVARGEEHTDRSLGVAAFAGLTMVTGWAWLVSMALLQEDFNRLAETDFLPEEDAFFARVEKSRPVVKARVELEPMEQPEPAPSRWQDAPSAPVFLSNAPAPVVY
ncbi:MAG: DUF4234 domain-containing protein [Sandaracinaceae bacterium]